MRELEQGCEEEANCCPPRSACPSCSRNHPHSFGRCPFDGGCQGLHGELLARWFACSCRVCGHHAVFANPEQGSLDEGFVQATKQGRQITTSLRLGKVEKLSPGPHVAISPLRAQRYPPTLAPTNRPTNHSEFTERRLVGSSGFSKRNSGESVDNPDVCHLWHAAASVRAGLYRPLQCRDL